MQTRFTFLITLSCPRFIIQHNK